MPLTKDDNGRIPEPDRPALYGRLVDSIVESIMSAVYDPYSGAVSPPEPVVRLAVVEGIERVEPQAFEPIKSR